MTSDPVQKLRHLDPGGGAEMRSPAEVRRRGDQMRRRRQGRAALAVAGAVAAVVVAAALTGGRTPVTSVDPAPPVTSTTTSFPDPDPTVTSTDPSDGPSDGSTEGSTDATVEVPTDIPGDFPLVSGWPDPDQVEPEATMGLVGPEPDLEDALFDYTACGRTLPSPAAAARLRATYRNVEDARSRQLLTFDDAQLAVAFMDDLAAFYRACPDDPGGPQTPAYRRTVVPTAVGGQSFAVGGYPPAEQPVGSTQVLHAVRLGSAVLLDTTEGEGGGAPDIEGLTRERAALMAASEVDVVGAMCRFTEAGC